MRVAEDLRAPANTGSTLTLTPGPRGIFDVVVNGGPVFSKLQAGRYAQPGEIPATFSELIGPDVPVYGT